jgi:hypothetical protein
MNNYKKFYYIDENNCEQIDLISLFEFAFDYKIDTNDIIIAISILEKHIKFTEL